MTHDGTRRHNRSYGDSPVRRSGVPIASSVLESCSPLPTLAVGRRHASTTRGTASRLPFGSRVESWPPQPSACPATQPPLCRVLLMHARLPTLRASVSSEQPKPPRCERRYRASSVKGRRFSLRRSREETHSVRPRTLLARSIGKVLPTRPAIPDGSGDSWVAGSASSRLRLKHADRERG
jgi:hypothetical protein